MKKPVIKLLLPMVFSIACINSCSAPLEEGIVGADRDAHGCIGSAGYLWCEHSGQCERPWELAEEKGFENRQEYFDSYCNL